MYSLEPPFLPSHRSTSGRFYSSTEGQSDKGVRLPACSVTHTEGTGPLAFGLAGPFASHQKRLSHISSNAYRSQRVRHLPGLHRSSLRSFRGMKPCETFDYSPL
jgi:hypothetical protein